MKRQISVRVENDVYKDFKKMCVDRDKSMSGVLEGLMREEVDKHE